MSAASGASGRTVGDYHLDEPLERTGELEAPLWWAHSERGEKALCAPLEGERGEITERYDRVQRLAHIDHPGLLPLVDSRSPERPQPYLCWLAEPTPTLRTQLGDYLPELRRSLRLARGIAEVLAAVHAAGEVFAGLAPACVLLGSGDRVVLLGPGLAAPRAGASLPLACARYRAPEQLLSGEPVDARADLWALGVVLFEMLNGHPPFPVSSREALLAAQRAGVPPNPSGLFGGGLAGALPDAVEQIERRALDPDPDRRYASAGELAADLDGTLAALRPRSTPRSARGTAPERSPGARPSAERARSSERSLAERLRQRRRRAGSADLPLRLWLLPLLVLAGLIALLIWLAS